MTSNPSILRRTFDAIALVAILNILGLVGLVGVTIQNGTLNRDKAQRMLTVLRGEDVESDTTTGENAEDDATTEEFAKGMGSIAESEMGIEIMRREGERVKAELDQRLALNNSILLRVTAERERIKSELDATARQQEVSTKQRRTEGFKKQIDIFESLAPKVAVQHLLSLGDPDEAAKILLEMSTGRAKKIVEAAKRGDQMSKMKAILRRIRDVAPDRTGELDPNGD
jgi:hypothetical protein